MLLFEVDIFIDTQKHVSGTGNGIAARCYGNCDPETAALAIVTGKIFTFIQ